MNEQFNQNSPEIVPEEDGIVNIEDFNAFQQATGGERIHEYPDSLASVEVTELDPEDSAVIEAFGQLSVEDQVAVAGIAENAEATLLDALTLEGKLGHNARILALGDALATAEGAEADPSKSHLLKKIVDGSLRVVRQAGTAGLIAIAAFSHTDNAEAQGLADYIPIIAGVAGATQQKVGTHIERGVIRPVERQMQGQERIERIMQQQQTLQIRYAKIDREKEELLLRASGNSRIAGVENRVENKIRPVEMDAKYSAEKAQLKADRAQLRAAYLSKPSHTESEQATYEAQIEQLHAREARLAAQYELGTVKDEVRRDTKYVKTEHGVANVYDQIERKNMEQERIMAQIQKLNMDIAKIRYTTSRDVTRGVLHGF